MREFQERKKWKRVVYSLWTLGGLFALFLILANATWGVYWRQVKSSHDREKAENALALAVKNNTELKEQISKLQTEKGIEEEIRKKYSVSKPGEEVAIIVEDKNEAEDATVTPKKTWWKQMFDFFKF